MPITARAAIAYGVGRPMIVEEVQVEGPREGEVLVEMKSTGLCHSDLHILDGSLTRPFPIILGHEGAGVVLECGAGVKSVKPGDKVIPAVVPECRECDFCVSGRTNLCREYFRPSSPNNNRFSLECKPIPAMADLGTFASHAVIREISLAKVRDDAPLDLVSYIGCGVVTGLGAVITTAAVRPGASVIVFGLGGIGLNVVQGARLSGATTIVGVDTNSQKEAIGRRMGLTHFVNPTLINDDLVGHLTELTNGGTDFTFECVGNVRLQRQALECARWGWGLCTLVGYAPETHELSFPPSMMMRGRRLAGSLMGGMKARTYLPELVDWYMNQKIEVDELVSHRFALDDINKGFDLMRSGDAIRSVVIY